MPEGDSVAKNASRLRPVLEDREVLSVYGTAPSLRANATRLEGRRVEQIRTMGKHLIIDFEGGYSVRVHLGMSGRWAVITSDRIVPGSARLALTTGTHHAVCFAAPTVDVDRTPRIDRELTQLGPDLLDEGFDPAEFVHRARTRDHRAIADVLIDQRVVAGIGNVYKSELLFLTGLHPDKLIADVSDERLLEIARRAERLLKLNLRPGARSTTGERTRGRETWVYDRSGKPCRRCAAPIESKRHGDRVTFWCPRCQPASFSR